MSIEYLTISSSATSFSFSLQYFPASGSFPVSPHLALSGQSYGTLVSASVLLMYSHGCILPDTYLKPTSYLIPSFSSLPLTGSSVILLYILVVSMLSYWIFLLIDTIFSGSHILIYLFFIFPRYIHQNKALWKIKFDTLPVCKYMHSIFTCDWYFGWI